MMNQNYPYKKKMLEELENKKLNYINNVTFYYIDQPLELQDLSGDIYLVTDCLKAIIFFNLHKNNTLNLETLIFTLIVIPNIQTN